MSVNQNDYEIYQTKRKALINLIDRSSEAFAKLDMKGWVDNTSQMKQKISADSFKVMVVGEFKRGKSTFINALLGEEVLPADAIPCTAVINEIKWSDQKRAVLHFRNPLPQPLPTNLSKKAGDYIRRYSNGDVPEMEVPVDELNDYVRIADPGKDQSQSVSETPYESMELYWPLDLCRNGVEIIDSPGLNEHRTRTTITTNYLAAADAVLFVISCQVPISDTEMQFIESNIHGAGHEEIFFILNRFDDIKPKNRDTLMKYVYDKLDKQTTLGKEGIFFLSAYNALEGRLNNDEAMITDSGIVRLEDSLSRFLTNDRGKIKLLHPSRELTVGIKEARYKIIPAQRAMLDKNLKDLEQRYQKVKPRLDDLEKRKKQIVQSIDIKRNKLKGDVKRASEAQFVYIADHVPAWMEELKIEKQVKLLGGNPKKQAEEIVKEIVQKMSTRIEAEQNIWQKNTFEPLVKERIAEITSDMDTGVKEFYLSLDQIKMDISGVEKKDMTGMKDISESEKFWATAGGLLFGGIGSALIGSQMGYKEMAKSAVASIGVAIGLAALGLAVPIILIPAVIIAAMVPGLLKIGSLNKDLKANAARQIAQSIRNEMGASSDKMAEEVFKQTERFSRAAESGLDKEIKSVRDQVESVLNDKRAGEQQENNKRALLDATDKALEEAESELVDFVFMLAGTGNGPVRTRTESTSIKEADFVE